MAKSTITHNDKVHHGEMKISAKIKDSHSTKEKQNLAGKKGTDGAKKILVDRYKKS